MSASVNLDRENHVVLMVLQALLGLVSSDLLGVAVRVEQDRVLLYFAVDALTPEVQEDIDDVVFETEVFLGRDVPVPEREISVGYPALGWVGRNYRLVFLAKRDILGPD